MKFMIAPFLERYHCVEYGKRKTWVVIGGIGVALLLILMSRLTDKQYQSHIAVANFFMVMCISVQSISLNVLALKELREPRRVSMIEAVMRPAGRLCGSLVFLKLSLKSFAWNFFGRTQPLMAPSVFLLLLGLSLLGVNALVHFWLQETVLDSERCEQNSLVEVFGEYRIFLKPEQRYCRQAVFFLIINQGNRLFKAGFQYELIRRGFSKERLNELTNLMLIPVVALLFMAARFNLKEQLFGNLRIAVALKLIANIIAAVWMPTTLLPVAAILLADAALGKFGGMVESNIVNEFPVTAISGMLMTALNSVRSIGYNPTVHLKIIHQLGWDYAILFGFVMQAAILLVYGFMVEWVEQGTLPLADGTKPR